MFRHHNKRSRGQNGEEGQTTGKLLFDLEKAIREQQGQLRQTKNSKSPNQALLAAKAGEAYIELLREKQATWKELCQRKEEEAEATINKLEQDWKTEIEARQAQLVVPRAVTTENPTHQFDQRQVEQWLEQRLEAQRVELENRFNARLIDSQTNSARQPRQTQNQVEFFSYVNNQHNLSEAFKQKINIAAQQQAIAQMPRTEESVMDTIHED